MPDFCASKNITSDIGLIDIKDIHKAYERMERGDVRYRFVMIWLHFSRSRFKID